MDDCIRPKGPIWLLLFFLMLPAGAVDPQRLLTQLDYQRWTVDHGLPQNTVFSVVQARDGYIWVGTPEGVTRFNGTEFKLFDMSNTPELRENAVRCVFEDNRGTLWLGTIGGGLTIYRNGRFEQLPWPERFDRMMVHEIVQDKAGTIWMATSRGLIRYEYGGDPVVYARNEGLPDGHVLCVALDSQDNVWAGTTSAGVVRRTDDGFEVFGVEQGLPSPAVTDLAVGADGAVFIGTNYGLAVLKEGEIRTFSEAEGLLQAFVWTLFKDRDDNMWIGTYGGGLFRFRDDKIKAMALPDPAVGLYILGMAEDREGGLWVGTLNGGLRRLQDAPFTTWATEEGLHEDLVFCLLEDSEGQIWIGGNEDGISIFDGQKFRYLPEFSGKTILTFHQDSRGRIWIGTDQNGVFYKDKGQSNFVHAFTEEGLSNVGIGAIVEDETGKMWFGTTANGIFNVRDGRVVVYNAENGLGDNSITTMLAGSGDTLWIATGSGLSALKDGTVTTYTEEDGLPGNFVTALYEDAEGALWIGTHTRGMGVLKDEQFYNFRTRDGLFDDSIHTILEDRHGGMWMSCNRGVFSIPKSELWQFAHKQRKNIQCRGFGVDDGMKNAECNSSGNTSGLRASDGRLWFPTVKGVAVIEPMDIKPNTVPPPIHIEQVLTGEQRLDPTQPAVLPSESLNLEIDYAGLSYVVPEKVQYQYRLEGFDPNWRSAGNRRAAFYTHLPPGEYRFQVRAGNRDGVWSEVPAGFAFEVKAKFYQTSWFFTGVGFFLFFFGMFFQAKVVGRAKSPAPISQENEERTTFIVTEMESR